MRKIIMRIVGILGSFMLLISMMPLTVSAEDLPAPAHSKYVTSNPDGTYTLTLDVTGKEESETVVSPIDILLIVDKSESMSEKLWRKGPTKMEKLQQLVSSFSSVVLPSKTINQMAVVSFSGNTGWKKYNDATLIQDWTSSGEEVRAAVNAIQSDGGTNWEAGFMKGGEVLNSLNESRANSKKYVVFLSDGDPTFHYDGDGYTVGKGYATGEDDVSEAIAAASEITSAEIYSVGVGGNVTRMQGLATSINGTYYDGSTDSALDAAFEAIESQIVKNYKQIVISDTLSEYAEMINPSDLRLSAQDQDGNEVAIPEGASAAYDEASKTVTWTFPSDYVLASNVTYAVNFDIRATKIAQQEYVKAGNRYPAIGDDETGGTSAGQAGFYSNSSATLSYVSANGTASTPMTASYSKPVIQVTVPITELPKAGGSGTWWLYVVGIGMIGFAGTLLIIQKIKQRINSQGGLYD